MERVKVKNTNNGKIVDADVLLRTDKKLRVAFVGTNVTLTLMRTDIRKPYVGYHVGLEFTSQG